MQSLWQVHSSFPAISSYILVALVTWSHSERRCEIARAKISCFKLFCQSSDIFRHSSPLPAPFIWYIYIRKASHHHPLICFKGTKSILIFCRPSRNTKQSRLYWLVTLTFWDMNLSLSEAHGLKQNISSVSHMQQRIEKENIRLVCPSLTTWMAMYYKPIDEKRVIVKCRPRVLCCLYEVRRTAWFIGI